MQQTWCAICSYPNKRRFRFGTVLADLRAPQHEVEQIITRAMLETLPEGFTIHEVHKGQLVFIGD